MTLHAFVHGRVQGVGFREACVHEARRLGLTGWVRNRLDGRVEVLAHGPPDAVAALRAWLAQGPPAARVERVDVQPAAVAEPDGKGFERRPTA
ncbi:acylphosphatase [Calidifontimicrobium sp. SYSU G02091]|uniref:acylphosphatase n=1 Tax=Calidifontimicrobium sp. SYSU G02091 TaxID=2926421 RepID=UPI001F532033|nr:acylphosphatase [Calidifontimicrobium sp. SYSU G02091]MCI1190851.1 acylphosphatase [Calidifontimicrobium sp. SYSU G02091]